MNPYKRMFELESQISTLTIKINGLATAAFGLETEHVLKELVSKLTLKVKLIKEYESISRYYEQLPDIDKVILRARYKDHKDLTELVERKLSYRTILRRLAYYNREEQDVNTATNTNNERRTIYGITKDGDTVFTTRTSKEVHAKVRTSHRRRIIERSSGT